jgi:hypothetical protein
VAAEDRVIGRTPTERATRLWRWAIGPLVAGVTAAVLSPIVSDSVAGALSLAAPGLLVVALLLGGMALTQTTRRPELAWIVVGLLVFWVLNSALYLNLVFRANNTLDDVPDEETIALLSTLFTAGIGALVAAVLIAIVGWVVRPSRWLALNGPGGQS